MDLNDASAWIAQDNPDASDALADAVHAAAREIGKHPHVGRARPELARPPIRFLVLASFPYILVYNSERRPPLILRVLHGARDLPELLQDL